MAHPRTPTYQLLCAFHFLLLAQTMVFCYQYKVGDLDSWGVPTSAKPLVYSVWSKYHTIRVGDSLLFLYPPSQDSVIQVTEQSYNTCNLKNPILYMNDGNSLFNITKEGVFHFTSGVPGHCEKKQKLRIAVGNVSAYSPSLAPGVLPEAAGPAYPTVFGTIPAAPSSSASRGVPSLMTAAVGYALWTLIRGSTVFIF